MLGIENYPNLTKRSIGNHDATDSPVIVCKAFILTDDNNIRSHAKIQHEFITFTVQTVVGSLRNAHLMLVVNGVGDKRGYCGRYIHETNKLQSEDQKIIFR